MSPIDHGIANWFVAAFGSAGVAEDASGEGGLIQIHL